MKNKVIMTTVSLLEGEEEEEGQDMALFPTNKEEGEDMAPFATNNINQP